MKNSDKQDLIARDRLHVWHPYTQHGTEKDPVTIVRASGASLFDADGDEMLDLISSWWTCVHGHSHPAINKALCDQANKLEHVMFAGFTHQGAVDLAEQITKVLGAGLSRVFYSDNGSTANEVALKMSYQYCRNKGDDKRTIFLSFAGDYHGDTIGAMAVSRGSGFFKLFEGLMCEARTIPFAATFSGDQQRQQKEEAAIADFAQLLDQCGDQVAALILEPLMQGAAGMQFCTPNFLRRVVEMAQEHGIIVILDEVATGFGRTGSFFAFQKAAVRPDIVCLSKGLTAGYMALSMTVVREDFFQEFAGDTFNKALAHGHSFTGNPLACAVALKSLALFEEENTFERIAMIEQRHKQLLPTLQDHPLIEKPRILGTVLAFDLRERAAGYKSNESIFLRDWYLQHGLNIRPYGKTIYLMPPFCISNEQIDTAYEGMLNGLGQLKRK
ncbi:MAG: adenosylmethionine--8-amino-7-oxononanoate transaminase [bacterium]|nr:adenosylmethionine--8-amino-7-oxononanoate transaminase [bacterium]